MPDRESVITHLQIIHTWAEFARKRDLQFFTEKHLENMAAWADEAIALLKEDCHNCKLECLLQRYDKLKEKYDSQLKEREEEISRISNAYLDLVGKASKQPKVVRCKDCWKKGNPYLCRFDRDLEEHGGHRTEADDDWFCADGQRETACDGCAYKGSEDCALGKPGSENAYCPNGILR